MRKVYSGYVCLLIALAASAGCGSNGLAQIEGTVTLDGEPLEGANVEFAPLTAAGSASYSIESTDADGHFTMGYTGDKDGVLPGKYRVYISTEWDEMLANGRTKRHPERVPRRYNGEQTELEVEVVEGKHDMPFDLTSE